MKNIQLKLQSLPQWPHKMFFICMLFSSYSSCADPESCQRGSNFDIFLFVIFLDDEGCEDQKYHKFTTKKAIIGPPAKCHLNGVLLAGGYWPNIECWLGNFVIFQRSGPVLLKTLNFCDFSGGSGPPVPASFWICPCSL